MTSKINGCLDMAARQNHISQEEAEFLKKRYAEIRKKVGSDVDAKAGLIGEIEAEAANRKRVALISETVRENLLARMLGYRNANGEADILEAWQRMHEKLGRDGGRFDDGAFMDAATREEVIRRMAHGMLADLLLEFKKGAVTGDLRRTVNPKVAARMQNVVRELFGEATGDAKAAAMAQAWTKTTDALRVRFNEAGGMIGKLEKWGLPQGHDRQALLDYTKSKWVAYMMGDGVLDRDRMVHPLTKRRMSDNELREGLGVSWDRITTDGWIDREVTGTPVGRGALWSQHADHRFLHFKNADAWMAYAERFGQRDPFVAMMDHINVMARDIAHMETFGPNPQVMRTYMSNWIRSQAHLVKSTEAVIKDQAQELRLLGSQLTRPNPDYARLVDQYEKLILDLHKANGDIRGGFSAMRFPPGRQSTRFERARIEQLTREIQAVEREMRPFDSGVQPKTLQDEAVAVAMQKLMDEMRDPIQFSSRRGQPEDNMRKALSKADAMWEAMRGSNAPESVAMANAFAATRNMISAASLGAAWFSSISDAGFGQDMRLRFGMGLGKSNFGRIVGVVLKEMIDRGTREDAIRAGLGLDSAIQVMHRKAKESRTFDGRAWSGFLADRVLSLGLLNPWTQAGKHMAGLDVQGFLADVSSLPWKDLPAGTQNGLSAHGFDAASWDIIRKSELHEPKRGVIYLRPQEIEATAGRALAERYLAMILRETRYAVPETTVQSRAWSSAGTKPGTLPGELTRSMMQFKGFGLAVIMLHTNRIARDLMALDRTAMGQAGALLITSAFLGAIAMALKDVKDGRDPRKWLDEKTYLDWQMWGAAALQAGGLGIYGDFLFSDTGRHGGGFTQTIAGPLVGRVDNLMGLTMGNLAQRVRGEKTNFGREATRAVRQNTPGGNLWWIGLAYQRVLMDQLQHLADPDAHAAFRRQMLTRRKDYGQEFWWRPGETMPQRAPDISRILATR